MNLSLETPIQLVIERTIANVKIKYAEIREITQGGPEVGKLFINNNCVSGNQLFGGPCIYYKGDIYIPAFIRNFFSAGFKLCRINAQTLEFKFLDKMRDLIYLKEIEDGKVIFYEDLEKTKLNFVDLSK